MSANQSPKSIAKRIVKAVELINNAIAQGKDLGVTVELDFETDDAANITALVLNDVTYTETKSVMPKAPAEPADTQSGESL